MRLLQLWPPGHHASADWKVSFALFLLLYSLRSTQKLAARFLRISIVMAIYCDTVMGGEPHIADGNYRSFFFSALFFVWELKISTHHFLWCSGRESLGTNVDVYLAVSLSITVITTTSYLSGRVHIFSVRQQYLLSLHRALHGWNIPSSQAKQEGFGSVFSHGGRKGNMGQLGKDNSSLLGRIILRGFFLFEISWVEMHLVTEAFWQCIMQALDDMAFCCNEDRIRYLQRVACAILIP